MEPRPDDLEPVTGIRGLVARNRARVEAGRAKADETYARNRHRPVVDIATRIIDRDREAAGSVVGSAIAFRLFLFFVPMLLFVVGLAGFMASLIDADDVEKAGITGTMANQIEAALDQRGAGRWVVAIVGLIGMATTGRTLSKVMVQASCLSWRLPISKRAPVRVVGGVIGLIIGIGLVAAIVNQIRDDGGVGVGVTGVSCLAAFAAYSVAWLLLSLLLPRATTDPGVLLPGSVVVGATLTALQMISQLYLPSRFERASELYGTVGATIVVLGWFFFVGRAIVLSMTVDAAVYERFGSISHLVFGLPVLRAIPRRWPWFRQFFQLDR